MRSKSICLALISLSFLVSTRPAGAVVLGQLDDFQNGTMGWTNGQMGGAPPVVTVANGGPAGAGDAFLQMTADGSSAGSHLTTFNFQQWIGSSYVTSGVTSLQIDLRNQGNVSLSIRFAFQADALNGAPGYLSTAMLLPVGSGWQHFSVSLANLIPVGGPAPFSTFYNGNTNGWLRIINEVGTSNLNGDIVVGQLGIDNIRAIPEPTTVALLAGGALCLAARVIRRKRRT